MVTQYSKHFHLHTILCPLPVVFFETLKHPFLSFLFFHLLVSVILPFEPLPPSLSLSFLVVPGPVDYLTAIPSFFKIYYVWRKPLAPNGIITSYTIHYESNSTSESSSGTVSGPQTCFSTPEGHEMGSEVNLTVVAFTSIGAGVPTTLTAYTLSRPRECLPYN